MLDATAATKTRAFPTGLLILYYQNAVFGAVFVPAAEGIDRVVPPFAVNNEPVLVFSRLYADRPSPRPTLQAFEWAGHRVPVVETAGHVDFPGLGRLEFEGGQFLYRLRSLFRRA